MTKKVARRNGHVGQSLTEIAITLPLVLLILLGTVDLGRAYFAYITLVNTAREGARYGAEYPGASDNAVKARALNEAQGSIITLSPSNVDLSNKFPSGCSAGNPYLVKVTYNFQLITSYIFGGTRLSLQTSAQMAVFGQCS